MPCRKCHLEHSSAYGCDPAQPHEFFPDVLALREHGSRCFYCKAPKGDQAHDPGSRPPFSERVRLTFRVMDSILAPGWRSAEASVGYGEDGGYEFYETLSDGEVWPVAVALVDELFPGCEKS